MDVMDVYCGCSEKNIAAKHLLSTDGQTLHFFIFFHFDQEQCLQLTWLSKFSSVKEKY